MKRIAVFGGMVLAALVLGAGVADAHCTLNKASVPANTSLDIAVRAQVEQVVGYNQKIVLHLPAGFTVSACTAPEGYACATPAGLVTWTSTSPTQNPVTPIENYPFKMRTIATPGKYKFDIDQTYSNGDVVKWNGAEGTENPAYFLTVTGEGTGSVTATTMAPETPPTTETTSPSFDFTTDTTIGFGDSSSTSTTVAASTTPTTAGSTNTPLPNVAIKNASSGGEKGLGGGEKVLLLILALLAVGAAAFGSWRQRRI